MVEEPQKIPARLLRWMAVAALVFALAFLGQLYFSARTELVLLRDQQQLAGLELVGARHQIEAERILANRQLADATKHLGQLDAQIGQSTHQLALAKRELTAAEERLTAAHRELAAFRDKPPAPADPAQFKIAVLAPPLENPLSSGNAFAAVVWNPSTQQGVLHIEKLSPPAHDRDYQLWLIGPAASAPVNGGVFAVDPSTGGAHFIFKPNQPVGNAARFAVSLERKGGAARPAGVFILIGDD